MTDETSATQMLHQYWDRVSERMVLRLAQRHCLGALVVRRHRRYNQNNNGLSYRVRNGYLMLRCYNGDDE